MGVKGKSDIANTALRIFLAKVGEHYDRVRNLPLMGKPVDENRKALLDEFENKCAYCEISLQDSIITFDHVIPINKSHLGLHAWGNVVPCCSFCNNLKQGKPFNDLLNFLKLEESQKIRITEKIISFQAKYNYDPQKAKLKNVAKNLYEDIGEVTALLVNLRLKQAQTIIEEEYTLPVKK